MLYYPKIRPVADTTRHRLTVAWRVHCVRFDAMVA